VNLDGAIVKSNSADLSLFTVCFPLYQVNSGAGFPSAAHFNVTWLPTHEVTIDGEDRLGRIEARAISKEEHFLKPFRKGGLLIYVEWHLRIEYVVPKSRPSPTLSTLFGVDLRRIDGFFRAFSFCVRSVW
jgi:hypothetical protein